MSLFVFVVAAVSYLSVSADFFVLVELDGLFRMLSACVFCLPICLCFLVSLVCVLCARVEICLLSAQVCVCV